jgi:DHA1 family tetracycline resistance protein-like MFS transporter
MNQQKSLLSMAPLFLVLMIDGMGLGLLFPILNSIIVDPSSAFLSAATTNGFRDILYGFIIGIFMICWFFGSAILGDLSDTVGRKRVLVICLLGAFGGYFISAIAITCNSIGLLIAGRIIAGFTSGSQPIAQAAIVDVSTPEYKARNIGLVLLFVSLGFIMGPILGGILCNPNLVSWFNFATPLYFAAAISLLNTFLLWAFFHETFKLSGQYQLKLHHALIIFQSAFRRESIRYLSVVLLTMIVGWSSYFTFISVYMLQQFHFTPMENGLFLAVLGIGFSLGCGYLIGFFSKRFELKNITIVGLFLTALVIALMIIFKTEFIAWISALIIGTSLSIAYSALLAMFSNQVSHNEQGWVMGVTGSIMALCFGVTSFFSGFMAHFGADSPIFLAVIGLSGSAILLLCRPIYSLNKGQSLPNNS